MRRQREETPGAKVKSKAGKHRHIKKADYPVCPKCNSNKWVVWYTEHEYQQHKKGRHKGLWDWRVQFRGFVCWHKTKGKKCWYHFPLVGRPSETERVCKKCGSPETYNKRLICHDCYVKGRKLYERRQAILKKNTKFSKILNNLG